MPVFVRVLIVVIVCFAILIAIAVGIGVYWWSHNGQALLDAGKQAMAEGKELGRSLDQDGCLKEAVARYHRSSGFSESIANNIFLRSCLATSRPSAGFCDGVPKQSEILASVRWQTGKCPLPADANSACRQLYTEIQRFCGPGMGAATGAPTGAPAGARPEESPRSGAS